MTEKTKNLTKKQPVVVLVGHIDHGKSSILQKIRDFKITEKETGGITQHIGAYEVEEKGQRITFIDTPGHEAFMAMRARGAQVADIAILVVAADEGVKPQTKEAISHIKKANIPMIVAINKIDKPNAEPERVKDGLSKEDVLVEQRGGKIPLVELSAQTGKGINELLSLILLVAEITDLKTDLEKSAEGVIIESYLDNRRGPIATLLLENGTLKEKEIIGTNSASGSVKRMEDFQGKQIEKALAGQPVLVLGFEHTPVIGEKFKIFNNLEQAKQAIKEKEKEMPVAISSKEGQKILNLIVKTDVLGSIEPIRNVLNNLPQEKILLKILKTEAGNVSLSDIQLAETGKATILGFRVKISKQIAEIARIKNIKILSFDLIYDLVEGVREFMQKVLTTEVVRVDLAELEALVIFRTEKRRQIVGARVLSGEITKGVRLEIFRSEEGKEQEKVGSGRVIELQKDKKEIEKGKKGDEIGILYEGDIKIQEGDILKAFEKRQQKVEL